MWIDPVRAGLKGAVLLALTGCTTLGAFERAATPLDVYELRAPSAPRAAAPRPLDVIVELPEAGGAIATDRVMIRPAPMQAQYLADARWADPLPETVQTLMVRTLSDTGALRYVGRRPLGVGGDFAVLTELTDFQAEAEAAGPGAVINLRMIVRLVRERDATVVSTRTITAEAQAATTKSGDVIAAFDRATGQAMQAFAVWLLGSVSGQS